MDVNDKVIEWAKIDADVVNAVCGALKKYECDTQTYLANIVASLCDVDVDDMLDKNNTESVAHARWLLWYAYRYMTNGSYAFIAKKSNIYNGKFNPNSVQNAVSKMMSMIDKEYEWRRRWNILKAIIGERNAKTCEELSARKTKNLVIRLPKALKDSVTIEYY